MDQRSTLAENLRVLRAKQNLNIKDAASKIGITRETLRDLENGTRDPYPPTLARIATGYNISVRDMLSPAEELITEGKAEASSESTSPKETTGAGPTVKSSQETSLLDDPHVVSVLRGWGYVPDEEYRTALQDFDPEIDEEGISRGVERAIKDLQRDRDRLLKELKKPTNYKKLFPQRSSFSKADELGSEHIKVLRASYASKLRREVGRIYKRRILALTNFSVELDAAGESKGFLVPDRIMMPAVQAAHQRMLEALYAGQRAG